MELPGSALTYVAIGLAAIVISLAIFVSILLRYVIRIAIGMPVAQWVTLEEVAALGVPQFFAVLILEKFYEAGILSVRVRGDYMEMVVDELEIRGVFVFLDPGDEGYEEATPASEDDIAKEAGFDLDLAPYCEYMLHRRPKRKQWWLAMSRERTARSAGPIPVRA